MNDSGIAVRQAGEAASTSSSTSSSSSTTSSTSRPRSLKVKDGGGLAGHNGLRSIVAPPEVRRLPARPHRRRQAVVEGTRCRPRAQPVRQGRAQAAIEVTLEEAADAVEMIATDGVDAAMTKYNAPAPSRPCLKRGGWLDGPRRFKQRWCRTRVVRVEVASPVRSTEEAWARSHRVIQERRVRRSSASITYAAARSRAGCSRETRSAVCGASGALRAHCTISVYAAAGVPCVVRTGRCSRPSSPRASTAFASHETAAQAPAASACRDRPRSR